MLLLTGRVNFQASYEQWVWSNQEHLMNLSKITLRVLNCAWLWSQIKWDGCCRSIIFALHVACSSLFSVLALFHAF